MIGDIIYNDLNTEGRLECDGSLVSAAGYPELVSILQQWYTNTAERFEDSVSGTPAFNNTVSALSQDADYIYVGGWFIDRFAVIRKSDWALVSGTPTFNSGVTGISQDADYIYAGGSFTDRFVAVHRDKYIPDGFYPLPRIPPMDYPDISIPVQIQAEE